MHRRCERLVFFGTPDFALPSLQALVGAGRAPVLVVSRPPRPAGRGGRVQEPPVAAWAAAAGLPLAQPERVRDAAFGEHLRRLEPDLAVVVAFGQIFPADLLALPRHGCVNVHASLLPRHRGAAPIPAALRSGDQVTGVTTMLMDEGLDTGPLLLQAETRLGGRETAGELAARLAHLGAALLLETLDRWEAGAVAPRRQEDHLATLAPRLARSDGEADWGLPADRLFDLLRALSPWPGLSTVWRGEPLKVLWGEPLTASAPPGTVPGTVLGLVDGALAVTCGEGSVFGLLRVQRPGRQPVSGADYLHGEHLEPGARLGE